jgi:hypothetical protein
MAALQLGRPHRALGPGTRDTAFWWVARTLVGRAVICGALLRNGPLVPVGPPSQPAGQPGRGEIAGIG